MSFMQLIKIQHPAASNQPGTQSSNSSTLQIPPFNREKELSQFKGLALEDALTSLISMTKSTQDMLGPEQVRDLNLNLDQINKSNKVPEGQYVHLSERQVQLQPPSQPMGMGGSMGMGGPQPMGSMGGPQPMQPSYGMPQGPPPGYYQPPPQQPPSYGQPIGPYNPALPVRYGQGPNIPPPTMYASGPSYGAPVAGYQPPGGWMAPGQQQMGYRPPYGGPPPPGYYGPR